MKLFKVKRISDDLILFIQERELISEVVIPSGWNLENNYEILEEEISDPE